MDDKISQRETSKKQPKGPTLNVWYTYGARDEETATVVFTNESRGIKKTIIDNGIICGFPGIAEKEKIVRHINEGSLEPRIRFRTDFSKKADGRIIMLWMVQPDGRYWADEDDFGFPSDSEVRLYSYLDADGNFTEPFRLYSIGATKYLEKE